MLIDHLPDPALGGGGRIRDARNATILVLAELAAISHA
jgi:hypothetical protein